MRQLLTDDSPDSLATRLVDGSKLADPAIRTTLWKGGQAAIDASDDPMIALAKRLDDAGLAIIDKRRPQPNHAEVMNVIGEVTDKTCVLIDDMVDTAGTLCQAAAVLKQRGAVRVVAYITHPVLSGPAVDRKAAARPGARTRRAGRRCRT